MSQFDLCDPNSAVSALGPLHVRKAQMPFFLQELVESGVLYKKIYIYVRPRNISPPRC